MQPIVRDFWFSSPDKFNWSLRFGMDNLPIGFNCESIEAQVVDLIVQRRYGVTNALRSDSSWVEFDAPGSFVRVSLIGPDDVAYAHHSINLEPKDIMLAPGEVRRFGVPYDWYSYRSDGVANSGPLTTTSGSTNFEGPPGIWPWPQVWRLEVEKNLNVVVHEGVVGRVVHPCDVSARCIVKFNPAA